MLLLWFRKHRQCAGIFTYRETKKKQRIYTINPKLYFHFQRGIIVKTLESYRNTFIKFIEAV